MGIKSILIVLVTEKEPKFSGPPRPHGGKRHIDTDRCSRQTHMHPGDPEPCKQACSHPHSPAAEPLLHSGRGDITEAQGRLGLH